MHNHSSNEDLLCCRVCLKTDCKLFNIKEYKLSEDLSRISGTPVLKDQLPQYLCAYCHTLLLKCTSFKDMCLRTERCLKLMLIKGKLNTECIRRIDHPSRLNLTVTAVHIVNCIQTIPSDVQKEPNDVINTDDPTTCMDIKCEVDLETDEDNLGESNMDEVHTDTDIENLGESNIDEARVDTVDVDCGIENAHKNMELLKRNDADKIKDHVHNDDEARLDTVDRDCGIRNADKNMELLEKNDADKIKDNIYNDDEAILLVNKKENIKTYKRKIIVKKKIETEMQGYSGNINDKINKVEAEIDLDPTKINKAKINICYPDMGYPNMRQDADVSDIDDINEVEAHMKIVDIDSILKKCIQKRNTFKRKIVATKSNKADIVDSKPVKRGRRKKERKIKYRNPANDYLPVFDFSKFESDYGVRIVLLSKQEQLEEVAARKQSHNYISSEFKCEDCWKGFNMEDAYNNHRRRHNPSSGEHACEICAVRFKRQCLRHRHQDMHKLKFICNECGFVVRNRVGAKLHHEAHKGRTYVCQHCGKVFSKLTSYFSHVRAAHADRNVACGTCGETFVSEMGLKMHKTMMHYENMKPERFKCTTCSANFISLDALNRHTDTGEHSGSPCEQCGESCASEEELRAHAGERHPAESHNCEECRAAFSSSAAFDLHYRRKHLNERYRGPKKRVRKLRVPGAAPPPPPPRGQFVCEQCGHVAPNLWLLRYHQNGHLAVKPYACTHCPKTFATNAARTVHVRIHTGEKPYKCPRCPRSFSSKANCNRHRDVVHLGVHANASCHVCGHVFTTKGSLRLHVNTVHNGQPWPKRNRKRKVIK